MSGDARRVTAGRLRPSFAGAYGELGGRSACLQPGFAFIEHTLSFNFADERTHHEPRFS